jgi:hypothetical protein
MREECLMKNNRIKGFIAAGILALALGAPTGGVVFGQSRGLTVMDANGKTLASFSKSYALVIGESAYSNGWQPLSGVKEDVRAVKKLFEERGFTVETVENAKSRELRSGIESFLDNHGYDENTRLLIYYAGHGHTL